MKKIFLSYGTLDARHVAEWLSSRLREVGYEVWWDRQQLPQRAGSAWDSEIESAIRTSDAVVALMSPHSVRERGECRNEINFACDHGRRIVPVLVRRCDRPLRINSLQYVDLDGFDSMSADARERQLDALVRAIENGPAEDPALTALHAQFPRFDFEWMYSKHRCFVGRRWLLDRFDSWAAHGTEPVLFLVGSPGIGKSAVLTEWVKTRMRIGGVHFCRHDREDLRNPESMVASLAGQLLRHDLPGHRESMHAYLKDPRSPKDAGSMFDRLVLDPLRNQPDGSRWVLAIDALDEGGPAIYDLLARTKPFLDASKIRLLLTSRPESEILQLFEHKLVLRTSDSENMQDVGEYVRVRLSGIDAAANANAADRDSLAERIVTQSEGTFLIAQVTLDELEAGRIERSQIDGMSGGLASMYSKLFARRFPTRESFSTAARPLEVVMAAMEPVNDEFIAQVLGMRKRSVEEALHPLGSLLPKVGIDGARVPFHKSLFDWIDAQEAGTRFSASREQGEHAIVDAIGKGLHVLDYGLRWAIKHLDRCGRTQEAEKLLGDLRWLDRRIDRGYGASVRDDLGVPGRTPMLRELYRIVALRLPIWVSGDSSMTLDAVNLPAPQGPLHLRAIDASPRPFLELLSERPMLQESGLQLPHEGLELALALEDMPGVASDRHDLMTLSRDGFMVWDRTGRTILSGRMNVAALNGRDAWALMPAHRGTKSGAEGRWACNPVGGYGTLGSDPKDFRWFHSFRDGRVTAVRFGARHISWVELAASSGFLENASDAEPVRALLTLGYPDFHPGRSGMTLYIKPEFPNELNGARTLLYDRKTHAPRYRIDAGGPAMQGNALPQLARGRAQSPEAGHRLFLSCAGDHSKQSWRGPDHFASEAPAGLIIESSTGRYLAWRDSDGNLHFMDRETGSCASPPEVDDPQAVTWSPCDRHVVICLPGRVLVKKRMSDLFAGAKPMAGEFMWNPAPGWGEFLPPVLDGGANIRRWITAVREGLTAAAPDDAASDEFRRSREFDVLSGSHALGKHLALPGDSIELLANGVLGQLLRSDEPEFLDLLRSKREAIVEWAEHVLNRPGNRRAAARRFISRVLANDHHDQLADRLKRNIDSVKRGELPLRELIYVACELEGQCTDRERESSRVEEWWAWLDRELQIRPVPPWIDAHDRPNRVDLEKCIVDSCALLMTARDSAIDLSTVPDSLSRAWARCEVLSIGRPPGPRPAGPEGDGTIPKCVRMAWTGPGKFEALSPNGKIWMGIIGDEVGDLGRRYKAFRTVPPWGGQPDERRGIRVASGVWPDRPNPGAEWGEDRIRIRGHRLEVADEGGSIASYFHSTYLKGYVANQFDPTLVAAIDDAWNLLLFRLHRQS